MKPFSPDPASSGSRAPGSPDRRARAAGRRQPLWRAGRAPRGPGLRGVRVRFARARALGGRAGLCRLFRGVPARTWGCSRPGSPARARGSPCSSWATAWAARSSTLFTLEKKPDIRGDGAERSALKPGADVSKALIATSEGRRRQSSRSSKVLELDPKQFSRDPAVVKENETDPLILQEPGPARTAARAPRRAEHARGADAGAVCAGAG